MRACLLGIVHKFCTVVVHQAKSIEQICRNLMEDIQSELHKDLKRLGANLAVSKSVVSFSL